MNCGMNVKMNPMNVVTAASLESDSGYMRPVSFGHQKCTPARNAINIPPTMTKWKCATMKYVSVRGMSMPSEPRNTPVSPPMVNKPMKPNAYSIGVSNVIEPLCSVNAQLKILIAEGTATSMVSRLNTSAE